MAASAVSSVLAGSLNSGSGWGSSIIRGQVSAHSSAWMRDKWFGGDKPDYGQVAADAFGNALVDYVVLRLQESQKAQGLKNEADGWYRSHQSEIEARMSNREHWLASNSYVSGEIDFDVVADFIRSSDTGSAGLERNGETILPALNVRALADGADSLSEVESVLAVKQPQSVVGLLAEGLLVDFPKSIFGAVREGLYTNLDAVALSWKFVIEGVSNSKVKYTPLSSNVENLQEHGLAGAVLTNASAAIQGVITPFKAIYEKDYRVIGASLPFFAAGSVAGIKGVSTGIRRLNGAKVGTPGGKVASTVESDAPALGAAGSDNLRVAKSNRLSYMGRTPSKYSRTGREVVERMRSEGLILGAGELLKGNPNNLRLVNADGSTVRIGSNVDMAHKVDAVTWWNETGRFYGAKSPEVRNFMMDSDNYLLQVGSINRSAGASLKQVYLPPAVDGSSGFK